MIRGDLRMRCGCVAEVFFRGFFGGLWTALGGFLGQNVAAFVSAVISGAAGTYVLTLVEDAVKMTASAA